MEHTEEKNNEEKPKTVKKRGVIKMAKTNGVDTNTILNKIFGDKKSDFEFGTLQIKNDFSNALKTFAKEDLAIVIEEALSLIDIEKLSKEYDRKKEK